MSLSTIPSLNILQGKLFFTKSGKKVAF